MSSHASFLWNIITSTPVCGKIMLLFFVSHARVGFAAICGLLSEKQWTEIGVAFVVVRDDSLARSRLCLWTAQIAACALAVI
jgi:hypothetical protein